MHEARDLAAGILWAHATQGAWVREGLEAARERLADPRDRGLLTELAYGVVRRQGTLDALLSAGARRPLKDLDPEVHVGLRLGLYPALFLDRVPDHAAVDHAVGWVRRRAGARAAGFVNGTLRALLRRRAGEALGREDPLRDVPREDGSALRFAEPVFSDPARDRLANLAERWSCPRWLCARWQDAFGAARLGAILRAGITRPPVTLRTRVARDRLAAWLKERGVAFDAGPGEAALRLGGQEAAAAEAVRAGLAWVQDATSQRVVPRLMLAAGQRVLDLCAAPGGKAVQIADRLGTGRLVAADVDAAKVATLEALAPQMGSVAYEARRVPPEGPLPFEPGSFDRVLVDAPCSNTGVLRRRVEARWRLGPDDLSALARVQRDLLARAFSLLAPGGLLVYSTCSLEAEENEEVVAAFAAHEPAARPREPLRIFPCAEADGGFSVVIARA